MNTHYRQFCTESPCSLCSPTARDMSETWEVIETNRYRSTCGGHSRGGAIARGDAQTFIDKHVVIINVVLPRKVIDVESTVG